MKNKNQIKLASSLIWSNRWKRREKKEIGDSDCQTYCKRSWCGRRRPLLRRWRLYNDRRRWVRRSVWVSREPCVVCTGRWTPDSPNWDGLWGGPNLAAACQVSTGRRDSIRFENTIERPIPISYRLNEGRNHNRGRLKWPNRLPPPKERAFQRFAASVPRPSRWPRWLKPDLRLFIIENHKQNTNVIIISRKKKNETRQKISSSSFCLRKTEIRNDFSWFKRHRRLIMQALWASISASSCF